MLLKFIFYTSIFFNIVLGLPCNECSKCQEDQTTLCTWEGHCVGSSCNNENDCSDSLICIDGLCGNSYDDCSWPGHCLGASCNNENDCSDSLICISGLCGHEDNHDYKDDNHEDDNHEDDHHEDDHDDGDDDNGGDIPITSGSEATLTYFTDTVFQCITGTPPEYALAVNPLLLGFSEEDWVNLYSDANPSDIPWCGRQMNITVDNKTFTGTIIDTCDPVGNPFTDPNTGETIGGKCGYDDVIDLYGNKGLEFLQDVAGDDFYQGEINWVIV